MKRLKTAIQLSEVSFLLFTIKQLYILQPNRQGWLWKHTERWKSNSLHRLVFTGNLLWIDEYVMIDINLSLYLHRQRNLLKQPPLHKLRLSLQTKVTLICPGWQSLNSLLCFFLFNTATSLQCSNFYFGASLNYENPRGNLFTMVMLFVKVFFLTIWVWLCYVMSCKISSFEAIKLLFKSWQLRVSVQLGCFTCPGKFLNFVKKTKILYFSLFS